jgi:long-chain fatty acid transport protein
MRRLTLTLIATVAAFTAGQAWGQGYVLPSVGAVNGGMAGAGTAAPLDAAGAVHWNPASITAVGNRVDIGAEAVNLRVDAQSSLGPFSGSTRSDSGVLALPVSAAVYSPKDSDWAVGIGVNGVGGFLTNYPAVSGGPAFAPQPVGLGSLYSRLAVMQVMPTVAVQLTDTISIGVAPTISAAELQADPFPFNGPNANFTYPDGTHGRARWGGGVQAGIYHRGENGVDLGFSFKSPQWFEPFKYQTADANGMPRTLSTDYVFPVILSWGAAYRGIDRLVLASDLRYIDYTSTPVFGDPAGFDSHGAVTGLGWKSIFVAAFGAQYSLTDWFDVRTGYSYSQNPVPASATMFNLQAPGIHQHIFSLGGSLKLTEAISVHAAWQHLFANDSTGPLYSPLIGAVPGSSVKMTEAVDAAVVQLSFLY